MTFPPLLPDYPISLYWPTPKHGRPTLARSFSSNAIPTLPLSLSCSIRMNGNLCWVGLGHQPKLIPHSLPCNQVLQLQYTRRAGSICHPTNFLEYQPPTTALWPDRYFGYGYSVRGWLKINIAFDKLFKTNQSNQNQSFVIEHTLVRYTCKRKC